MVKHSHDYDAFPVAEPALSLMAHCTEFLYVYRILSGGLLLITMPLWFVLGFLKSYVRILIVFVLCPH